MTGAAFVSRRGALFGLATLGMAALVALSAASPASAETTLEKARKARLHPHRLRQRGAVRLRHARGQADGRGARGRARPSSARWASPRSTACSPSSARSSRASRPGASTSSPPACSSTRSAARRSPSPSRPTASGRPCWCKTGNPKGIKDYATFAGNPDLKLAVMAGAVEGGYAKDSGVKPRTSWSCCPTSRACWPPCSQAAPTRRR